MVKKWILLCIVAVVSGFGLTGQASAAERYVALGDSIAAGQTPYREIDHSYTDLVALKFAKTGNLETFTKELSFPGNTVEDVIQSIQSERAAELLNSATLVTISAGANDLLPLVKHNPEKGSIQYSQVAADFSLNRVRNNMTILLQQLEEKAPNAKVYVMGYFFPYTSLHDEQRAGVEKQVATLNAILRKVATNQGVMFVEVPQNFSAYLPNLSDVHPTREGYLQMANAFLRNYSGSSSYILQQSEMPPSNALTFEQLMKERFGKPSTEAEEQKNSSTNERQENQKVSVKPIEQFVVYYGYERALLLFS